MADEPGTKTIQETSKRLKLHTLISVALIILGVIGLISGGNDPEGGGASSISWLLLVGGIVWYFVTRFRIWWNHG